MSLLSSRCIICCRNPARGHQGFNDFADELSATSAFSWVIWEKRRDLLVVGLRALTWPSVMSAWRLGNQRGPSPSILSIGLIGTPLFGHDVFTGFLMMSSADCTLVVSLKDTVTRLEWWQMGGVGEEKVVRVFTRSRGFWRMDLVAIMDSAWRL